MTWLPVQVTAQPATEPVTLTEAKAQLRVTDDAEDTLISGYIKAARQMIEDYCGIRLVQQTLSFKGSRIADLMDLPAAPIQSITSIAYLDTDGANQTLSADVYEEVLEGLSPQVRLKPNQEWPAIYVAPDAVRVVALAGFTAIPEPIRQAILVCVTTWHDNREVGDMNIAAMHLVQNYRRH